ncbi:MAG: 50S ribosomal protein L4 [Chloroflexi bacterium]|nr:50S ribosomal protein L4 [Chloroflexota bacterium]
MQLPLYDTSGATVGTVEVSDLLFNVPMHTAVVHQAMVRQLANKRQGTSDTKTRAEVSGGGIKPRPQKHSGKSRQGSIRSPQWRHGGVVFGPHPRSYHQRMPKKMRRQAIRCLLSDKVSEQKLMVVQSLELPDAKTRAMTGILHALNINSSVLLVTPQKDDSIVRSARNLEKVTTLPATDLNVVDLLHHDHLVMTVDAVRRAEALWAVPASKNAAKSVTGGEA